MKKFICTTLFALLSLSLFSQIQLNEQVYIPEKGAKGKDVMWWPTPDLMVKAMLDLACVVPSDTLIDLGSGDGRIVIDAAKRGAYGIGIEYQSKLVDLSIIRAAENGVSKTAVFVNTDLLEYDVSAGTVISMFLLPELNLKLRSRLMKLRPGTRIISNTFDMGKWEPDDEITIEQIEEEILENSETKQFINWKALLWIVPEEVEGLWIAENGELNLKQQFQQITGTFKTETENIEIQVGRLRGKEITFEFENATFTGMVTNHQISGTITSDNMTKPWSAIKSVVQKN